MTGVWIPWTDEESAKLRELWAAGVTAKQIAEQLPGKTRNAVIGRAARLGLERRDLRIMDAMTPEERQEHQRQRARANRLRWEAKMKAEGRPYRPAKPRIRKQAAPARQAKPLAWQPRPPMFKACQWIAGDPMHDDSCKCGAPVFGGAYCEAHYRKSVDVKATAASMGKNAGYNPRVQARVFGGRP